MNGREGFCTLRILVLGHWRFIRCSAHFLSSFAWQLCFFSCNYNHYELSLVVVIFWNPFDNFFYVFRRAMEHRLGNKQIRLDKVFTLESNMDFFGLDLTIGT
jgi:hypothetical protein